MECGAMIENMTEEQIAFELAQECTCKPDLPDGRCFPMCTSCKVRQDLKREREQELLDQLIDSVLDRGDVDDTDIPFWACLP